MNQACTVATASTKIRISRSGRCLAWDVAKFDDKYLKDTKALEEEGLFSNEEAAKVELDCP